MAMKREAVLRLVLLAIQLLTLLLLNTHEEKYTYQLSSKFFLEPTEAVGSAYGWPAKCVFEYENKREVSPLIGINIALAAIACASLYLMLKKNEGKSPILQMRLLTLLVLSIVTSLYIYQNMPVPLTATDVKQFLEDTRSAPTANFITPEWTVGWPYIFGMRLGDNYQRFDWALNGETVLVMNAFILLTSLIWIKLATDLLLIWWSSIRPRNST